MVFSRLFMRCDCEKYLLGNTWIIPEAFLRDIQYFMILMKLITVNLPEAYVNGLERLIFEKLYPNRSEAIRIAVRDLLKKELWGSENSIGSIR